MARLGRSFVLTNRYRLRRKLERSVTPDVTIQSVADTTPISIHGRSIVRAGNRYYALISAGSDAKNPGIVLWYTEDDGANWKKHSQVSALAGDYHTAIAVDDEDDPSHLYMAWSAGNLTNIGLFFGHISTNISQGTPGSVTLTTIDVGGASAEVLTPSMFVTNTATNPRVWIIAEKQTAATTYETRVWYCGIAATDTAGNWTALTNQGGYSSPSVLTHFGVGSLFKVGGVDKALIVLIDANASPDSFQSFLFDPTATTPSLGTATATFAAIGAGTYDWLGNMVPIGLDASIPDYAVFYRYDTTSTSITVYKTTTGTSWSVPTGWSAIAANRATITSDGIDYFVIRPNASATPAVPTVELLDASVGSDDAITNLGTTFGDQVNQGSYWDAPDKFRAGQTIPVLWRDQSTTRLVKSSPFISSNLADLADTLTDDFATLDLSEKWMDLSYGGATVSSVGGQLVESSTTAVDSYGYLVSRKPYKFTFGIAYVKAANMGASTATNERIFRLQRRPIAPTSDTTQDVLDIKISGAGSLTVDAIYGDGSGNATVLGSVAYNPATMVYFRWTGGSGSTIVAQYSADASAWTTIGSITKPTVANWIDAAYVALIGGHSNSATAYDVTWDDFNVAPVGGSAYTDSGTVTLTLTPSSSDVAAFIDSSTVPIILTPNATDAAVFVDTNTANVIITPSSADTKQNTDAATVTLALTPSSTDIRERFDAAEVYVDMTPSAADVDVFVDTNTATVTITPSATDVAARIDTGTVSLIMTPSATDIRERTDAATVSLALTPSAVDAAQFSEYVNTLVDFSERISPDAFITETNLTGAIANVQDDPDSPDANWLVQTSNNVSTVAQVSFPLPTNILKTGSGLQEIRVLVAKTAGQIGSPTVTVDLYEAGNFITNIISATSVTSTTGQVVSGTWDASLLADVTGADVEVTVTGTQTGGAFSVRATVDIGAIEWNALESQTVLVPNALPILTLTPSGSDTFTTGGNQTTDSATVILALTPSSSDIRELFDSATVSLVLTPSATDQAQFADSNTVTETLTPSSTDTLGHTDSATVTLTLTPSETDTAQFVDSGTVTFALTPSSTDIRERFDSATVSVLITPSASDIAQFVDTSTVTVTITPSCTDIAQFIDTNTALVTITPSSTDIRERFDAATVSVLLTPSATDQAQFVDANTASLIFTPSSTDVAQDVDTNTVSLILTPSSTNILNAVDSATVSLMLTPSSTEVFAGVDSATIPLVLTISSTDIAQFVDTGSVYLGIVASSIDIRERFDANTVTVALTPSATDTAQFVDSASVTVLLTPSSTDIRERFDSGTVSLVLSPSTSDAFVASDTSTVTVILTPSTVDAYEQPGDAATAIVHLSPSASESAQFVDSASVTFTLTPSATDTAADLDANTVSLKLTPSTSDTEQAVDAATVVLKISVATLDYFVEALTNTQTSYQTIDESIHVFLVPVSDISTGTWHDTPLYEKVDEYTPDPSDYIESGNDPVNDTAVLALRPGNDPVSSSDHFINIQFYKHETLASTVDLIVRLKEGSTVISEQVLSDVPNSLTTLKIPLTSGEIDSIGDYGNLSFELVANEVP